MLVGYGVKAGSTTRRARKSTGRAGASAGEVSWRCDGPAANGGGAARSVLAKPPVRKLARDLGVDLAGLTGTGPSGSITRDDVQRAAARPGADRGPGARHAGRAREERIPIRGVRKHTAAAVTASAFTAPHVTEFLQVDVTATMDAVARLRDLPEFAGVRVSPLLLVARALLIAVARHPMINSTWDEDAQEIVVKHYVNLGIAAATERGLIVPNIKDAGTLSLPALAGALAGLAETARAGKASPADLTGGTITITNVGVFGVDAGTPILTPAEAAILAFGQVKDAPWVLDGQLAVRKVTTLVAVLRPPHRGRRPGLGRAPRRGRDAARPAPDAGLGLTRDHCRRDPHVPARRAVHLEAGGDRRAAAGAGRAAAQAARRDQHHPGLSRRPGRPGEPGNADFAVVADFDDAAGYLVYRDDPAHRRIIAEYLRPILASRAAVQFES